MGGRVAVGVISEDGWIETTVGRTNALPSRLKTADFVAGDHSALDDFIEYFRHNRHDEGFGLSDNYPTAEYGYIVVDLAEKAIYSAQGYFGLSQLQGMQIDTDGAARMVNTRISWDGDERVETPCGPYASLAEFKDDLANDPRGGVPTYASVLQEILDLAPTDLDRKGEHYEVLTRILDSLPEEQAQDLASRLVEAGNLPFDISGSFSFGLDYGDWKIFDGGNNAQDLTVVRDYLSDRDHIASGEMVVWNMRIAQAVRKASVDADFAEDDEQASTPAL